MKCRWDYMGKGSSTCGRCRGSPTVYEGGYRGWLLLVRPKAGRFVDWALSVAPDELIGQGLSLV